MFACKCLVHTSHRTEFSAHGCVVVPLFMNRPTPSETTKAKATIPDSIRRLLLSITSFFLFFIDPLPFLRMFPVPCALIIYSPLGMKSST